MDLMMKLESKHSQKSGTLMAYIHDFHLQLKYDYAWE